MGKPKPKNKPGTSLAAKPNKKTLALTKVILKKKLPGKAANVRYSLASDPALTKFQALQGGIRPKAYLTPGSDLHSGSNLTEAGHMSGYHEVIVTEMFNFLRKSVKNNGGTHTLPSASSVSSKVLKKYAGVKVDSEVLEHVLSFADAYRTDTARTILSARGGLAAGHIGSKIKTTRQPEAHDLLRESIMEIVTSSNSAGRSKESLAALFGAIMVTSMAPAVIARTVAGGTESLKSRLARANWETDRNEAKARTEELYKGLNPAEKSFVRGRSKIFIARTQEGVTKDLRHIRSSGATSPVRETSGGKSGEVQGGGYSNQASNPGPTLQPPTLIGEMGFYISSVFIDPRRSVV